MRDAGGRTHALQGERAGSQLAAASPHLSQQVPPGSHSVLLSGSVCIYSSRMESVVQLISLMCMALDQPHVLRKWAPVQAIKRHATQVFDRRS